MKTFHCDTCGQQMFFESRVGRDNLLGIIFDAWVTVLRRKVLMD